MISRFQGEKKLASLPYTLLVTTGGVRARMRMGVDTPVPVTSTSDGGKQMTSIQYRNVGTNIDCAAWDRGDGRYQLSIAVENSSALALEKGPSDGVNPGGPSWMQARPAFPSSAASTRTSIPGCATARASRRSPPPTRSPARSSRST